MKLLTKLALPIVSVATDSFGLAVLVPLLPTKILQKSDNVSKWVAYIYTSQYAGTALGAPLFGRMVDWQGKLRQTTLLILIGDVFCFTCTAFFASPVQLMVIRFFSGFFNPIGIGFTALMKRCTTEELPHGSGLMVASYMGTYAVGSALAGALGWKLANVVSAGIAALSVVCVVAEGVLNPVPSSRKEVVKTSQSAAHGLIHPYILSLLCAQTTLCISVQIILVNVPVNLVLTFQATEEEISYIWLCYALVNFLTCTVAFPKIAGLFGLYNCCLFGFFWASLSLLVHAFLTHSYWPYVVLPALFYLAFMCGISAMPPLFHETVAKVRPESAAFAQGVLKSFEYAGMILGPVIAVQAKMVFPWLPNVIATALMMLAAAAVTFLKSHHEL